MHVFISYAHSNGDFVEQVLVPKLKEAHIKGWQDSDELRGGEDWRQAIDEALDKCFAVIIIMTPDAKKSEYVTYEWAYAIGARKTVIPILLNPTKLHPRLEALQYFDFTKIWNAPWDKLLDRLNQLQNEQNQLVEIPLYIQRAIDDLDSYLPATRQTAIKELAKIKHPSARDALKKAVNHGAEDVRMEAILLLAEVNDDYCLPYLMDLIRKNRFGSTRIVSQCINALGKIKSEAAQNHLLELFRQGDCGILEQVANALKENRWKPSNSQELVRYYIGLHQWDECVYLGEGAIPELVNSLYCMWFFEDIVKTLGMIGGQQATQTIIDQLYSDGSTSTDEEKEEEANLKYILIRTLGRMKAANAVKDIAGFLNNDWVTSEGISLSNASLEALEQIGTQESLAIIENWKKNKFTFKF